MATSSRPSRRRRCSRGTRCVSPSSFTRPTSRSDTASDEQVADLRRRHIETVEAISHEEWDAANASFHEAQVDLAGNKLLSRFYRELSVNLMMQVIRGGRVERHEHLVTEHEGIVSGFETRDRAMARAAITRHVESGRRIALEAVERAGGAL